MFFKLAQQHIKKPLFRQVENVRPNDVFLSAVLKSFQNRCFYMQRCLGGIAVPLFVFHPPNPSKKARLSDGISPVADAKIVSF